MRKRNILTVLTILLMGINSLVAQKPHHHVNQYEFNNMAQPKSFFENEYRIKLRDEKTTSVHKTLAKTSITPKSLALNFVNQINARLFKESSHQFDNRIISESGSPIGNHFHLIQTIDDIPVYGTGLTVTVRKRDNRVSSAASTYYNHIEPNTTVPQIEENTAIETARRYLGISQQSITEKSEQVFFNSQNRGMRLAYHVSIVSQKPMGDWQIIVDAEDGTVIHAHDIACYIHDSHKAETADGEGMVFDPDPLTTAGVNYGGRYRDFNDADSLVLNDERIPVVLHDLTLRDSGYVLEGPYAKVADMETPVDTFPVFSDPADFKFTRHQQGFEAVMVYYHVDKSYRRLMELGYNVPWLLQLKVDPHGLNGDDNSHYIPTTNYLAFGEGGVDDAEDADVIWHEYGHGIQQGITGNMNYSGETFSLMEGASDYWAASYSRSISEFSWEKIFTWDGHNEFWSGRVANLTPSTGHYPEDYQSGYGGAPLWSSALMEIWGLLGRDVTDKLFIQTHFLWGLSPDFYDAANAFIQADLDLYDGAHFQTIYDVFNSRGMINPDDYSIEILHNELSDTEDFIGPYQIEATIISGKSDLDTSKIYLVFGYDHVTGADTLLMEHPDSQSNLYFASIPSEGSNAFDVWYYFSVSDILDQTTLKPQDAPSTTYHFSVRRDTLGPDIVFEPLQNQNRNQWPVQLTVSVNDSSSVDSVWVEYLFSGQTNSFSGSFPLINDSSRFFSGAFDFDSSMVETGDSVYYRIYAKDRAHSSNISVIPVDSLFKFSFVDFAGKILLVDDEWYAESKSGNPVISEKGSYIRFNKQDESSPAFIRDVLINAGYSVTFMRMTQAADLDFDAYDIIIHSSGGHGNTLSDSTYRNKLYSWAQTDSSHKLIIEGGEIGYNWYTDNAFAQTVLHVEDWYADFCGDYVIQDEYNSHRIKRNYYFLPDTINIDSGEEYGDQDGLKTTDDAYYLYQGLIGLYPGIIVFEPQKADDGAKIIYFPFNGVRIDSAVFSDLLLNSVDFMYGRINPKSAIDEDRGRLPVTYRLYQNYPNPFNPVTTIRFDLPKSGNVSINIYNIKGQKIKTLLNALKSAGGHEVFWDGKDERGNTVATGIYFYQLRSRDVNVFKRMVFLK